MEKLPLNLTNKIFHYLSHPIADLLRDKVVLLRCVKSGSEYPRHSCVNFTDHTKRGFVNLLRLHFLDCGETFRKLWDKKVKNGIHDN